MRCTQPTRERVYLYWIKTKEVGATGHLDNGLRRLLSYYWPKISVEAVSSFQVQYWKRGQITNGESGLVSPRNLAHFWSAKFCNFDTRVMHSGNSRFDFFRSFLMNECKVDNVDLLLFVMKPVELTSKQFTLVVCLVMSVTKGAFFMLFQCVVSRCWILVGS